MSQPMPNNPSQLGARYPVGVARERVRDLSSKGLTVREIARLLDVSTQAVNWHLKRLAAEES